MIVLAECVIVLAECVGFVAFACLGIPGLAIVTLIDVLRVRYRVRPGWCLAVGLGAGVSLAVAGGLCFGQDTAPAQPRTIGPGVHTTDVAPDAPALRTYPLPDQVPALRLSEPRAASGESVRGRVLLAPGLAWDIEIRLAVGDGVVVERGPGESPAGRSFGDTGAIESRLVGGPFWVRWTGDRDGKGRPVGRVLRQQGDRAVDVGEELVAFGAAVASRPGGGGEGTGDGDAVAPSAKPTLLPTGE